MLTDLLRAFAEPAPRSLAQIAAGLGTSPDRLRIALEQCERLGYLDRGDDACTPDACGACPVACGVTLRDPAGRPPLAVAPTWWRLTERGRRVVAFAASPG
jgi:hypothetical protein